MEQACHRVVHEEGRGRDLALPLSLGRDVLTVCENAFPPAAGHDLLELICYEGASLSLQGLILGHIDNELHLFLVNAEIVVHVGLMTHSLKPVEM